MAVMRVWLKQINTDKPASLVAGYSYDGSRFGLEMTNNEEQAISLFTAGDDINELKRALFDELLTKNVAGALPLTKDKVLIMQNAINRYFKLWFRLARADELE